ncbi:methyltransferase domain-containing protein [Candidatus Kuenenbacteria bacterium]|nr:methyltransferase domain-containing protein [Candidatus Kuenenbacteria bacterium]
MNSNLKIKILYDFKDGPWGGANQFLKVLRDEFINLGIYEEETEKAECIIFYSYQKLPEVVELKLKYPNKIFIHRLGGILGYHKGKEWAILDRLMNGVASKLPDWAIFVSGWLYEESKKLGFNSKRYSIIGNAVDPKIFNTDNRPNHNSQKTKLIASSWSGNIKKGFEFYEYLDKNLDWSRYEMSFVGNCPVHFKNIKIIPPLTSEKLADKLKERDIYITATKDDACSNAIIEALACGLPVAALNSGGNGEIVQKGGELFTNEKELIEKIELISREYQAYVGDIKYETIQTIAYKYINKIERLTDGKRKKINKILLYRTKITLFVFNKILIMKNFIQKIKAAKKMIYRYYKFTWHRNALEKLLLKNIWLLQGRVLDIGSKNRRYDQIIKAEEMVAIDLEENKEANVLYGDIEKGLNYPDNYFDSILCLEVVEYLNDFPKATREMYRLIKPGGAALLSIPFFSNEHDDNLRPTKKFAEKVFKESGFDKVEITTFGNSHTAIWDMTKRKSAQGGSVLKRKIGYYLFFLPWLLLIRMLKLDKKQDQYYSGLFIILTK